ncbi:MAG: protease complex subunit PrcB family protein [Saccharofermentans sp.]|nr:protease complex subunit PrcB family protein [Saccharofermentans sp.]
MEEHDYPVNIIIAAGEFSTGGYDICIDDMNYDNNTFTVTVREIYPEPTVIVIEAFTYPCCEIQLNKLPGSVRVLDGTRANLFLRRRYSNDPLR